MAYSLGEDEIHTRVLRFPDGMDYVIAMEGWFWNALDWMNDQTEWVVADFIDTAWRAARETENDGTMHNPANFVAEFITAFRYAISLRMRTFVAAEDASATATA